MQSQHTLASGKGQTEMMKDYLARGPMTATERLVAQSGDIFRTPATSIKRAEELRGMEAYLNQLAKQVQGGNSNRGSSSSSSSS
ncbi:hypothetical protein O1611_g3367 [Lasiodiplodia mahajangana]|uniref:Uncharacterized protein n=1 Tax=Lasiodiplodia mahajangana TaxID=1108764 RepID=A0ACC2JRZ9_9PEZI|nr:hypothetical protein O1611_g3367 [Lasiodiplodia mahajangana]